MPKSRYQPNLLDALILLASTGLILYLALWFRSGTHYTWHWPVMFQYFLRYDPALARWVPNLLLQGFITTIKISIWATVLAIILGTIMGIVRTRPTLLSRLLGRTYVELVRNIPPLVLIFIFYFFISDQILGLIRIDAIIRSSPDLVQSMVSVLFTPPEQIDTFLAGLITLVIYEGAYITEIVRAGIESIEREQWDAAKALGFTRRQMMRHVILPQALARSLPPLAGQLVSTIKDSAIVSVISIQELTFQGLELMSATYLTFEIWITITALYFILTFGCSLAVRHLEVMLRRQGTSYHPA
ncbi:MAG: amino acid ABC transporter permease [Syntrophaceae bacterium]